MFARYQLAAVLGLLFLIGLFGIVSVHQDTVNAHGDAQEDTGMKVLDHIESLLLPGVIQGTIVTGTVSGTWDLASSPYTAVGALRVDEGTALTIEAGVEIRFVGQFGLSVYGNLVANGTPDLPVVFTSDQASPQPGDWTGLFLFNNDLTTRLEQVKVLYTEYGIKIVAQDGESSPVIESSLISHSERDGIRIIAYAEYENTYARPKVLNCEISNSGSTGISTSAKGGKADEVDGFTEPEIGNNNIFDNGSNGIHINATGGSSSWAIGIAKGRFYNNVVSRSGYTGIVIRGYGGSYGCYPYPCIWGAARPEVVGNIITNNGSNGISIVAHSFASGYQSEGVAHPIIANNLITHNGSHGISGSASNVLEDYGAKVINNTIAFNDLNGIYVPRNVGPSIGSNHDIYNNIIISHTVAIQASREIPEVWCNNMWANATNFSGFPAEYGAIDSTNANGDPSDRFFNILLDPELADVSGADYHLLEGSAAIEAGCDHDDAPEIDYDGQLRPQGERYDIGADEYFLGKVSSHIVHIPLMIREESH